MFNPHLRECLHLDELRAVSERRYGAVSQATRFILYDQLIRLRGLLAQDPSSPILQVKVADLRDDIQHAYQAGGWATPGSARYARVVAGSPPTIEFDRAFFDERYLPAVPAVAADLVEVTTPVLAPLEPGRCYMYVIDDRGRLLVWNRAFALADLAFGRNRATIGGIPVAHPMLVPDRLRVQAAGEVIFLGGEEMAAVILNNSSGHFQPPSSCAPIIREVVRAATGLADGQVDVFTLSGGVHGDRV
ncbi:hypothetical protein ACIBG8_04995 [Nonomuraea sp. NPDC050556]|uniref:hypothetical protein n=1 Tax=Nonomuraea sp. NPDC050556 TaxID=3364369 RepID=UPI0037A4D72C